jgi:succinoglycan biosynthesis transport protein ExoP
MLSDSNDVSLYYLFARYWKLSLFIIAACIVLAEVCTRLMPRRYEAEMKFLVNNVRPDLVITPEKAQPYMPVGQVTEAEVNSEIELLKSRDLFDKIVRQAHLYEARGKKSKRESQLAISRALLKLHSNIAISVLRKTNIIDVIYRSSDPDLAVTVLNELGDLYLSAHLAAHSPPGTYKFFTEQVDRYAQQLTRARTALSDFHRRKQIFSMQQQQAAAVGQLEGVEAQLNTISADIREQQARLNESQIQMDDTPDRITTQMRSVPRQASIEHLESLLADLRNRRLDLLMKFRPGDRFLATIDQQISSTEAELAEVQAATEMEKTTDVNVVHQSLKDQIVRAVVNVKALQTRREELQKIRNGYVTQLDTMDSNFATLENLEQYEKEALDNYTVYARRLDEARLSNSLDQQKFSNVVMIEKPVPSPIPVSPNRNLNLAVGALLGLVLSTCIALIRGSRSDPSNYSARPGRPLNFFDGPAYQPNVSGD